MKIQSPNDYSRVWAAPILTHEQEAAILRTLTEFQFGTKAALWGSHMGTGKTVMASEVVVRSGFERVIYVGVKETFDEWARTLSEQSDGRIVLRRVDATAKGKLAYADFIAGEPGHYFSGSQYLTTQDWTRIPKLTKEGNEEFAIAGTNVSAHQASFAVSREGTITATKLITKRKHLRRYSKIKPVDLVVLDEIHMVASRKSNGIGTVRSIPTVHKLGMSGTWYGNKFANAQTITRWAWPDAQYADGTFVIDPDPARWADRWCETESTISARGIVVTDPRGRPVNKIIGEKVEGEFVKTLPCYIRLESRIGAPPKPEIVKVQLTGQQLSNYQQMYEESIMWLEQNGNLAPLIANIGVVNRMRLRSATLGTMSLTPDRQIYYNPDSMESSKEIALAGVLRRPDWVGKSAIIGTEDKRFVKALVARMARNGIRVAEWSGDVSTARRAEIKAAFLAGEIQYIVCVISSFGTGNNGFQFACSRIVWCSESDNAKDNQQFPERIWRQGGDLEDFQQIKIVAEGTIDEGVLIANEMKTASAKATMRIA